jgi:hypothetical protein
MLGFKAMFAGKQALCHELPQIPKVAKNPNIEMAWQLSGYSRLRFNPQYLAVLARLWMFRHRN